MGFLWNRAALKLDGFLGHIVCLINLVGRNIPLFALAGQNRTTPNTAIVEIK
jgi:hypothetical protein